MKPFIFSPWASWRDRSRRANELLRTLNTREAHVNLSLRDTAMKYRLSDVIIRNFTLGDGCGAWEKGNADCSPPVSVLLSCVEDHTTFVDLALNGGPEFFDDTERSIVPAIIWFSL